MQYVPKYISPLRYPGSKALLGEYISDFINEQSLIGTTIVEPYAGSAIISFLMLFKGYVDRAILIERDPLLYAFWFSVFNHTDELIKGIDNIDVSIETWNDLCRYKKVDDIISFPVIDMGLAGLFYNRTNFSGILNGGPLGGKGQTSAYGIDCRFGKRALIKRIVEIAKLSNKITVLFSDALDHLKQNKQFYEANSYFLYIDPPYFREGKKLYRYWYKQADHSALAEFLLSVRTPWLVSYDDHQFIRNLYTQAEVQQTYFDYVARRPKRAPELLISNRKIPPLVISANNNLA